MEVVDLGTGNGSAVSRIQDANRMCYVRETQQDFWPAGRRHGPSFPGTRST